mmetsp:Transcript_11832/g.29630  ORF Transcript_11832/g.29630 Transcript_11832/m.29630 type:complete len:322 (+) Transcript_11832:800-1765(+)
MVDEDHEWRDVAAMSAKEAANLIHSDGIDILIELNGQTSGNRLDIVALRPAPIQMTYLGYPNTTGLKEVDYRITDSLADPEGTQQGFSEELLRLPDCFLCYPPPPDLPPVSPPPFVSNGVVTFGSFNYLGKITADVVRVWCRILGSVEGSRLVMKAKMFGSQDVADKWRRVFSEHRISPDRVDLLPHTKGLTDHLNTYSRVDIALDSFPYAGTTTTCEALLMGLPVVSLKCSPKGPQSHAQNVCFSLLSQVSLPDLATDSEDSYHSAAVSLANDTKRLGGLRSTLREALLGSPLCNGTRFCKQMGELCGGAWVRWCDAGVG